jgi:hypothetical protein
MVVSPSVCPTILAFSGGREKERSDRLVRPLERRVGHPPTCPAAHGSSHTRFTSSIISNIGGRYLAEPGHEGPIMLAAQAFMPDGAPSEIVPE